MVVDVLVLSSDYRHELLKHVVLEYNGVVLYKDDGFLQSLKHLLKLLIALISRVHYLDYLCYFFSLFEALLVKTFQKEDDEKVCYIC